MNPHKSAMMADVTVCQSQHGIHLHRPRLCSLSEYEYVYALFTPRLHSLWKYNHLLLWGILKHPHHRDENEEILYRYMQYYWQGLMWDGRNMFQSTRQECSHHPNIVVTNNCGEWVVEYVLRRYSLCQLWHNTLGFRVPCLHMDTCLSHVFTVRTPIYNIMPLLQISLVSLYGVNFSF